MKKVHLIDTWGYVVHDPEAPSEPSSETIIWGDNVFVRALRLEDDGTLRYLMKTSYVVEDTKPSDVFNRNDLL